MLFLQNITEKLFQTQKTSMIFTVVVFLASQAVAQVPAITSILPESAAVGEAVTISGANFGSTNAVYFGTVTGNITASTSSSITVTVPIGAGYAPVSITNLTNNLTAYSDAYFRPIFDCTRTLDTTSLQASDQNVYWPYDPSDIAVADLNGDGQLDFAVTQKSTGYGLAVSKQNAAQYGFEPLQSITTNGFNYALEIADFDGDGKQDIVVAGMDSTICIVRNTSTTSAISFAAPLKLSVGIANISDRHSLAVGDLDLDGKPDIAVAHCYGTDVTIFRNTSSVGSVSFAAKLEIPADSSRCIKAGDLDGDGKLDLVFTKSTPSTFVDSIVSVLRNTSDPGTISFDTRVNFTKPSILDWGNFTLGDVDGDGKLDIVATGTNARRISIFRNTSISGNFSFSRNDFTIQSEPVFVALNDINGDGKADIIAAEPNLHAIAVLENLSTSGTVALGSPIDFSSGGTPYFLAIGDMDNDGRPDIVPDNMLKILKNFNYTPVALSNPQSLNVCAGQEGMFVVKGLATDISYQWQRQHGISQEYFNVTDGGLFSGAQTDTLKISAVPDSLYTDRFRCVVSGTSCTRSDTSRSAVISLNVPPVVAHPLGSNIYMCPSNNLGIHAYTNSSYSAITWYGKEKGSSVFSPLVSGANYSVSGPDLVITASEERDSAQYFFKVSPLYLCEGDTAWSDTTTLLYLETPVAITSQPANKTVIFGDPGADTVAMTIKATGINIIYLWQYAPLEGTPYNNISFDSPPFSNTLTDSLVIATTYYGSSINRYIFRCIVYNSGSGITRCTIDTSDQCTLFVNVHPRVLTQPTNKYLCAGNPVFFSITAEGTNRVYHWQSDTGDGFTNLVDGGSYDNIDQPTLMVFPTLRSMHGYRFRCVVSGILNPPDTSDAAVLTLNSPPYLSTGLADTAVEDQPYSFVAAVSDSNGDSITYCSYIRFPSWLSIHGDSLVGTPTEGRIDTSFSVVLQDNCTRDTQTVLLKVQAVNDLPVITSPQADTAVENSRFLYRILVNDPDGPVLRLSAENLPSWLIFAGDTVVGITPVGAIDTSMSIIASDSLLSDTLEVDIKVLPGVSIEEIRASIPTKFDLEPNSPNPFNPTTTIRYAVPFTKAVTFDNYQKVRMIRKDVFIGIYDLNGRLLRTLVQGKAVVGYHSVTFDGMDQNKHKLGNGVYVFRMIAEGFTKTRRMIIIK